MSDKELKTLRKKIKSDRADAMRGALVLADRAGGDLAADTELEFALGRVEQLDRRLKSLPKVTKVREPDIYERNGPHSFFRDVIASVSPVPVPGADPANAQQRLNRHNAYESDRTDRSRYVREMEARAAGIQWDGSVQSRALSSITAGSGAEFAPPRWILSQFASVARATAPLRRLVQTMPLPDGTMSLFLPRVTVVSGVVGPEQSENVNPGQTIASTDSIEAPVRTFSGEIPVSQELFDRGPNFDGLVTHDFADSYAAVLESQLVNGTGLNGQLLGLLSVPTSTVDSVPGAIVNTYTAATPTTAGLVQAIAQTAALVADTRERPPSFALMRPSRYFWLAGVPDGSTNVATQRVGTGYLNPKAPDDGPFGPIAGLPAYLDATIPTDLGSGTNQDVVIVVRANDVILLEDTPKFAAIIDTAAGASQMTVFLTYHIYVAAFTSRYPSGIGSLTGTGLVVPSGW